MKPYYSHNGVVIFHGDCREICPVVCPVEQVATLYSVVTDPPYGMAYDTDGSRFTRGGRSLPAVCGDDVPFNPKPFLAFEHVVMWGFNHFPYALDSGGALVWIKRADAAFGCFLSDAELAWVKGIRGVYAYRDVVHAIACDREHPTQKPEGLMSWSIKRGTASDTIILDPYMGSGTTLVAAKRLGRRAMGIDIEERNCEIAAKRLSQEVLDFSEAK